MPETAQEVLKMIKDNNIQLIDLKFADMYGIWQHCTFRPSLINEGSFLNSEGVAFDGSSIRGWKAINNSDMAMVPDPTTAWIDPFMEVPTLSMICSIVEPRTGELYGRDPRSVAQRALDYLISTGIGDVAYCGPEPEFFIFDSIRYDQKGHEAYFYIDSDEGSWNSGKEGSNLGYKIGNKRGYFPTGPSDMLQDIRSEMLLTMDKCGVPTEKHHHEVAAGGQCELGFRFAPLVKAADYTMTYKYVVKSVARKHGKTATFMPKPISNDNGSGMHTHMSIWKDGQPLFAGDKYAGLSQMALYFIGGLIKHAPSILAFTNPTVNSYKRLVPGFEAPVNLAYSAGNRSASIRIPLSGTNPKAKRLEFRCPDASSNPYLTFAAMLCAGLDGIKNQIDPGASLDVDIYEMDKEDLAKIPKAPANLAEALANLESDHAFLTENGVFTEDFISTWISLKMDGEVKPISKLITPHEFELYYDC
jgi:glutamine synthetase